MFDSVLTGNQEHPSNFSSEPRKYGGVYVSDEEKVALYLL